MIKFRLNPAYAALKDEVLALPDRFDREGIWIYGKRNVIKILSLAGKEINVKSFKRPHIINRFIYAWFRKSKAERSYLNGLRLLRMGIGTPEPIAYVVYKDLKGVNKSYYISVQQQCDYVLLDLLKQRPDDFEFLFRSYVRFVYDFHQKGVYFIDLSTGNTLIKRNGESPDFYLVDLNRIVFNRKPLSAYEGMRNFCRIDLDKEDMDLVIREYALLTGETREKLQEILEQYRKKEMLRRKNKSFWKKFKRKRKNLVQKP